MTSRLNGLRPTNTMFTQNMLGTVVRGMRARLLLTLGSVLLAGLAIGSAVLGPMFEVASTNSYVVTRLNEAPNPLTGLTWEYSPTPAFQGTPDEFVESGVKTVDEHDQGPFLEPQAQVETPNVTLLDGLGRLLAKDGACDHVVLVEGACPDEPGEALMLAHDLDFTESAIGDRVTIYHGDQTIETVGPGHTLTDPVATVRIVGTYRAPTDDADFWFDLERLASLPPYHPERGAQLSYRPAPLIVDRSTFAALPTSEWVVRLDNRLDVPPDWNSADLATAVSSAEAMKTMSAADQNGSLASVSINDLPAIAREVHGQQQTARSSIAPAVLSLVLVALALLLRLLMAASEARVPELALASLRGLPSRQMWRLGLSEPLAVIAAAVPVGAVLGPLLAFLLVRWWLVPGLPLPFPAASLWAALLVVVAAVVVAAFAVGLVLRTTLAGLLAGVRRPAAAGRLALVGQLLLAAVVLSVLASKLTGSRGGQPDATDLVLPVLLAVFAGLVATHVIARIATWWTRQRQTTRSLAAFVAARAISRRREGTLVILPIAAAIAVCVFGAGVYASAAEWRASVAATRAPAAEVYTSQLDMGQTLGVSRELDPDGKWLMAVTTLQTTGPAYVVLDATRLTTVASWPDQWTRGTSVEEIQRTLVPPGTVPVLTGTRIGLRMNQDTGVPLTAEMRLVTSRGDSRAIFVGPFGAGESTLSDAAPFCSGGCRLEGISVGGRSAGPTDMRGTLTIGGIVVDGTEDPAAITDAAWVESPTATSASSVESTSVEGSSLVVDVDSEGQPGIAQLGAGGIPALPPVVRGYDADVVPPKGAFTGAFGMNVDPRITSESVPLLGPAGVMIDYSTLTTDRNVPTQENPTYMFVGDDAPESVRQELVGRGMVPTYNLADEKRTLDQSAYALALRLYAVIAVLVLLMALAGLVVSTAVQLPVRRRDAAALRVVGVRRGTVMSAVAREFAVVLGGAGLAGIAAGSLAQYVVLRTITLGYVEGLATPRLVSAIDWGQVAMWTVAASVVLGLAAFVSASLTVRGARGSTLRETAR